MENIKKNESGEQNSEDRNQNINVKAGTDNSNPGNKINTPAAAGEKGNENGAAKPDKGKPGDA